MRQPLDKGEQRTPEQIRQHYQIERELADRLRHADRAARRSLYAAVYDELYQRVPLHPQLTRKASPAESRSAAEAQLRLVAPFLSPAVTFMELGPGDCALAFAVARTAKQVYAVDVSDEISRATVIPANAQIILSDGCSVPVPPGSVNLAYSNQLMEHLHPDDALEQLRNIYAALAPGGRYLCVTPGRLTGPHDVSKYFDRAATGFHLKEYTITDLHALFRQVGFRQTQVYLGGRGVYRALPVLPFLLLERLLGLLPAKISDNLARGPLLRLLATVRLIGAK